MPKMIFGGFCKEEIIFTRMRLNKSTKIFINYLLGPLLFFWLLWSIYQQVQHQPQLGTSWIHIKEAFTSSKVFYLVGIVLLMLVNWGIEAVKWQLLVSAVHPMRFITAFEAVLSGVSFSVTTPNRIGDYLGRMLYMPDGKRLKIISLTLVGSVSQLLVTLVAGTISFFLLRHYLLQAGMLGTIAYQFAFFALLFVCAILTMLYLNVVAIEKWLERLLRKTSYLYLIEGLRSLGMQRLLRLLLLSVGRYSVFVIQYILAFYLFDVEVSLIHTVAVMGLVFLALAIIPSVVLLEVGIRGQVSLKLIGLFTVNSLGILLTSVTVWFINLVIPAVAGSLLILGIKVFKLRYEER